MKPNSGSRQAPILPIAWPSSVTTEIIADLARRFDHRAQPALGLASSAWGPWSITHRPLVREHRVHCLEVVGPRAAQDQAVGMQFGHCEKR